MSAAIGMALGFGYPLIALALTVFSIVALRIPRVPIMGKAKHGLG